MPETCAQKRLITRWLTQKELDAVADSGHFCPEGGSPLYTSSPRHPEFYYLKAGCLDDPMAVRATHQNWLKSRVSWATIGCDFAELFRRSERAMTNDRPVPAPTANGAGRVSTLDQLADIPEGRIWLQKATERTHPARLPARVQAPHAHARDPHPRGGL
jgi:hypothetical protein